MHGKQWVPQDGIDQERRRFCAALGTTVGAVCCVALFPKLAMAAELPHVPEDDATAKALGYKEDTTKVDDKKYPNHKPDQVCAKCTYYTGDAQAEYGPCQMFAGKSVHAKGWCQVYVKKA